MRFELAEDELMLRDMVRDLTIRVVAPAANDWAEGTPEAMWATLVELGLPGVIAPESAGGVGLDLVALAVVLEELAVGSGSLAARLAAHAGAATAALAAVGTPARDTLRGVAAGRTLAAWIPEGCWSVDAGAVAGSAALVPNADRADVFVVALPGAVAVAPREAVRVTPARAPFGLRGAGLAAVEVVDATAITVHAVADHPGQMASDVADAAVAVGLGRAALEVAAPYALERTQFGKPISRFQAVQWMIAESATELDAARLMVWHAGAGEVASAHARLLAGRAAQRAGDDAIQIHGGYGFTTEYRVERFWRDAHHCLSVAGPDSGAGAIAAAVVA